MILSRKIAASVAAILGFAAPQAAFAQDATLTPTVTVVDGCVVLSTTMVFDITGAAGTGPVDTNTAFTIECNRGALFRVDLDRGQNANGQQRRMIGPTGDYLPYAIYRNAARTLDWGTGFGNAPLYFATGTGRGTFTFFGRVPFVPANLDPGMYLDSVTITVDF